MRGFLWAGVFLGALASAGCFPDYQVEGGSGGSSGSGGGGGSGGSGGGGGGPVYITAAGVTFDYSLSQQGFSVGFSRNFAVDQYEVTVQRYQNWLSQNDPAPVPCETGTCSLDPDGPYKDTMIWDSAWNPLAREKKFDSGSCSAPTPYEPPTTWDRSGNNDYPMTCVSWFQAAAFCWAEGNRLLTQAEWMYVATGHGTRKTAYPWGDETPDCNRATIAGCTFPKNVGDETWDGRSVDEVVDLTGSVYEWVWDASWASAPWPNNTLDYAGPPASGPAQSVARVRRGGAFINGAAEDDLRNDRENAHAAGEFYADAGFRCARDD